MKKEKEPQQPPFLLCHPHDQVQSSLLAARYWRTTSHICLLCYQVPRRVGSRWVWWISSMLSAVWRLDGSIWFRYGDNREKFRRLVFYAISSLSNMNNTKVILFKLRTSALTHPIIHTYILFNEILKSPRTTIAVWVYGQCERRLYSRARGYLSGESDRPRPKSSPDCDEKGHSRRVITLDHFCIFK